MGFFKIFLRVVTKAIAAAKSTYLTAKLRLNGFAHQLTCSLSHLLGRTLSHFLYFLTLTV
jgi:hypothetical protein